VSSCRQIKGISLQFNSIEKANWGENEKKTQKSGFLRGNLGEKEMSSKVNSTQMGCYCACMMTLNSVTYLSNGFCTCYVSPSPKK